MLKHNENLNKKEKVKYDLYKILRMSVLLSQKEVDEVTLDKFKEASLNIDKLLSDEYEEKLDTMFYSTATLEEEERRLKDLVAFINERIEKRKELTEDYKNVTKKDLTDLEYISRSGELDLYEKRLNTIKDYLDNSRLIEVNEQDLETLKEQLVKEFDLKQENEIKNVKIEETLFSVFVNALYEMDLYSSLELTDIDKEIKELEKEIREAKEQKDTFESAFTNLKSSGISGDLELEYASYVENSRRDYYYIKEKEILLRLYKLIEVKEAEYSNLFSKREDVKELLQERTLLRSELNIKDRDYLSKVSDLLIEQKQDIENEKENVDNINVLTERIKLKENRLEDLKKAIKKPEILSILKEYSLIDTYNHDDILETEEQESEEEYLETAEAEEEVDNDSFELLEDLLPETDEEEEDTVEEIAPNQIKTSQNVPTMNFGLSRLKSISVMKRVGDMLGVNAKKEEVKETVEPSKTPEETMSAQPEILEVKDIFVSEETKQPETIKVKDQVQSGPVNIAIPTTEETTNVTPLVEEDKKEELFWTPSEFADMKKETEESTEEVVSEVKDADIFVPEVPVFEEKKDDKNIFETNTVNNTILFPEPVMPEIGTKVLPENKEEKFMWPENAEKFDINGIFPS